MEEHKKVWGMEEWIVNNDKYCGKILTLNGLSRCSIHYHKNKHETFYILDGKILMETWNDENIYNKKVMNSGDIQVIKPLLKHRFTGIDKQSRIIEFSTHHEEEDSYRLLESGKIKQNELEDLLK